MTHLIICGGREYSDKGHLLKVCNRLYRTAGKGNLSIIIGISPEQYAMELKNPPLVGADFLAWQWAISKQLPLKGFPADWDQYGKPAGPIRNREMATFVAPFLPYAACLAFWDGKSPGTRSMIREANRLEIPVHIEYY